MPGPSGSPPSWRSPGHGSRSTHTRTAGANGSRSHAVAWHLATIDPASEIPSSDLLPALANASPHIFTDGEIAALMTAARGLKPPLRAARHETLIGLLAVTGMRPGEAIGLDRQRRSSPGRVACPRGQTAKAARGPAAREQTFDPQDGKCEGGRHGFVVAGGHGVVAAGGGAARARRMVYRMRWPARASGALAMIRGACSAISR